MANYATLGQLIGDTAGSIPRPRTNINPYTTDGSQSSVGAGYGSERETDLSGVRVGGGGSPSLGGVPVDVNVDNENYDQFLPGLAAGLGATNDWVNDNLDVQGPSDLPYGTKVDPLTGEPLLEPGNPVGNPPEVTLNPDNGDFYDQETGELVATDGGTNPVHNQGVPYPLADFTRPFAYDANAANVGNAAIGDLKWAGQGAAAAGGGAANQMELAGSRALNSNTSYDYKLGELANRLGDDSDVSTRAKYSQGGAGALTMGADFDWDASDMGLSVASRATPNLLMNRGLGVMDYKGPSEAELQMNRALDQNVAGQMALAQSGRGAYSGQALREAQATAASLGQQTSAEQAALRAQEWATRQNLGASMLEAGGQLGVAGDEFRLGVEEMNLQGATSESAFELGRAQQLSDIFSEANEADLQAWQATQAAQQGWAQQEFAARQAMAQNNQAAWNQYLEARNQGLGYLMQGQGQYIDALSAGYGIGGDIASGMSDNIYDLSIADADRIARLQEAAANRDAAWAQLELQHEWDQQNSLIGALGSLGGAFVDLFS